MPRKVAPRIGCVSVAAPWTSRGVSRIQTRSVATWDVAPLRLACWDEIARDLRYADKDGQVTARRGLPLTIAYLDNVLVLVLVLVLLGWCCLRDDCRQFRIDRIIAATPTGDSVRPRRVALLDAYVTRMAAGRSAP